MSIRTIADKLLGGKGLDKYPLYRTLRRIFYSIAYPQKHTISGITIHESPVDGINFSEAYQGSVLDFMRREIKEGDIVADVGAHVGYFSIIASRLVGKSGKVYAFEPDLDNIKYLKKNLRENGAGNVSVVPLAVSDNSGEAAWYSNNAHSSLGFSRKEGGISPKMVKTTTLDDFFTEEKPTFIKLNICGSEEKAMQGAARTLKAFPVITSIFRPDLFQKTGGSADAFIHHAETSGYATHWLDNSNVAFRKK